VTIHASPLCGLTVPLRFDFTLEYELFPHLERAGLGNLPQALTVLEQALDIQSQLVAQDPSNAGWQRDLSVSLEKVGGIQAAQG
jgi:hypothetical protein